MSRIVSLGLVQMRMTDNPQRNFAVAVEGIREAAKRGAQIVCLPELFRSLYFCQSEDHRHFALAEPIPGPSTEALGALARELGVVIIASLFEKRAEGLYHNTAAVTRRRWALSGQVPQDAHPRRPALLREVLFHTWRSGVQSVRHALCAGRCAYLLGSVVP
jgi:predicted amidohydrolase